MPSEKVLQEKQALVSQLTKQLSKAVSGVVVDYKGISVANDTALRRKLREAGVHYSVVKNTLLGRAADEVGFGDLKEVLEGTTAIATSDSDQMAPARLICEYAEKSNGTFTIKGGFFEGKVVSAEMIQDLSKVPSREILLSMLLGGLTGTISNLARALNAVAEKGGEAPAEA